MSILRTFAATFAAALAAFSFAACSAAPVKPETAPASSVEEAVFAGGCFWCTESDFEKVPGVLSAISGYTGGRTQSPTYEVVSAGGTGHYEAVLVRFDPARVTYADLLERYWRTVDPTDAGGQFCDRGESYRTAIFVTPAQRAQAEASKARLVADAGAPRPIVTPILARATFTPAEDYHQDYYKKNPVRYGFYRNACGRDARLRQVWGAAGR